MDINYQEMADRAAAHALKSGITLDYSEKSIAEVESILGTYYDHLAEYDGKEGADTLWNIAVHYGIYLGETMLGLGLKEKGFAWYMNDGMPVLKNQSSTQMSPITKAHKRILNGPDDNVKSFCDVAFMIADGKILPKHAAHRAVNVQLPSGQIIENVPYRDIDPYIMMVETGREEFLILESQDGFFQFYGVDNQFVAEVRVNLPDGDFHTYSIIDKDKEQLTKRIRLTTPYGQFTPTEREVVSLELVKTVARAYYEHVYTDDFLSAIPYVDTTEITKQCMGLKNT